MPWVGLQWCYLNWTLIAILDVICKILIFNTLEAVVQHIITCERISGEGLIFWRHLDFINADWVFDELLPYVALNDDLESIGWNAFIESEKCKKAHIIERLAQDKSWFFILKWNLKFLQS